MVAPNDVVISCIRALSIDSTFSINKPEVGINPILATFNKYVHIPELCALSIKS